MGKKTFIHLLLCLCLNLVLSAFEIFAVGALIDLAGVSFFNKVIIYNVLFIVVNPVVVYLIIKKFFKFEYCKD